MTMTFIRDNPFNLYTDLNLLQWRPSAKLCDERKVFLMNHLQYREAEGKTTGIVGSGPDTPSARLDTIRGCARPCVPARC